MKQFFLFCFLVLFVCISLVAQNNTIDSLEKLLSISEEDTNRIELLNQLSYYYLYIDTAKVKEFDRQSLELSQKLNYVKGIALAYVSMGNAFYSTTEYDKALKFYYLSLEIAKKNNFRKIILASHNGIAVVYFASDELAKAKQIYLQQLTIYSQEIDQTTLFDYYNNLAACYAGLNSLDSSLYYLEQALNLAQQTKSIEKTILARINISGTYKRKKDFEKALSFLKETLDLATNTKNLYYIAVINLRISEIYDDLKNDIIAMNYCRTSIKVSDSMNYPEVRLSGLKVLANIYLRLNNAQEVYNYMSAYISLKDSISNDQKNKYMAELNTRYETAKKESDIAKLKESLQNRKRILYLVISTSLFLILVLVLGVVILRLRQKNLVREEKLKQQEKLLLQQELELKSNVEKELNTELENKMNEIKNNLLSIIKLKNQKENLIADFRKIKEFLNAEGLQVFTSINNMHKIDNLQLKISEFESKFEEINKDFSRRLLQIHPDLTPNEKRLCAFIAMDMSTIEISELTFQSENSIYVSRNRLKKKLNTGEQTIEDYLKQITTLST